ncbi:hypothetical protein H5410_041201 [Solanum commersonii]|uniref:Uncharacterized protein n=1 Tax=Solanum commersonii TaxID=4109 RepID=A0A9J5XSZ8_SOLCO|nr:hypothetical protein H5410_041201 [Solanum commersonii]
MRLEAKLMLSWRFGGRPWSLKGSSKFYRVVIRPTMLYGAECWLVKIIHIKNMKIAEMGMLSWMSGHNRRDKIKNKDI